LRNNGVNCPLYIFQSNGGVAEPDIVMRNPALTLLSGPAGAVIGATQICGQAGYKNLITMDIGGTSLDVCLVQNSKADLSTSREIDKFPISTPMLDVHTVGAGGGSIIRTDEVGRIKVGPESMGAHPGPACYGFGGDQPTLTDVNLLMGLLDPSSFANGEVQLDEKRSEEVIREKISKPLGIDLYSAIVGIYRVVTNQIAEEIRTITMEQGRDPRDYALVAFGGGGPLHAAGVARELGIGKVIIPKYPGLFSARGIATADFSHDYVRSIVQPLEEIKEKNIASIFSEMITHANLDLEKEGIESNRRDISCSLDMRYIGQTTEVNVPLGKYDEDWKAKFDQAPGQFHKIHEQLYTYSVPNEPIELVNIRVFAIGLLEKPSTRSIESTSSIASSKNSRLVLLPGEKTQIQVSVFKRENLKIGSKLFGPAIVEESSSSTLLLDEMEIIIDAYENMIINLAPSSISL
jgi:N-methylhydantoinase A